MIQTVASLVVSLDRKNVVIVPLGLDAQTDVRDRLPRGIANHACDVSTGIEKILDLGV